MNAPHESSAGQLDAESQPASANPELLRVRGLSKGYRLGQRALPVLQGLSLSVGAGEMVVIMGPSGSGKSTLLNCISGLDLADAGEITLGGEGLDYASEAARTRLRRQRIGMVFQFFNLIPTLSVRENVLLPLMIRGRLGPGDGARADSLLGSVGLDERRGHFPSQLSGGEMQLTSIARALVHGPELLLADEPTGNVNPQVAVGILEILAEQAAGQGAAVLMVTHNPEHAAWGDRVCFLKGGRIVDELDQDRQRARVAPIHARLLALGI